MHPYLLATISFLAGANLVGFIALFWHRSLVKSMQDQHGADLALAKRDAFAAGYQDRALRELPVKEKKL